MFVIILLFAIPSVLSIGLPTEQKAQQFHLWLAENNVDVKAVEFYVDDEGYGVKSAISMKEKDTILVIPNKLPLMLKYDYLLDEARTQISQHADYTLQTFFDAIITHQKSNVDSHMLAIFILFQRYLGRESEYNRWIAILPEQVHTPLFFKESDIDLLLGSDLYGRVKIHLKHLKTFYDSVISKIVADLSLPKAFFSFRKYKWAMSIVSSRSFPDEGRLVISIGADMFNHMPQAEEGKPLWGLTRHDKDYFVTSQRNYVAGEKIWLDYGNMPNSLLLLFYGFAIAGNRDDMIMYNFKVDRSDPLHFDKTEFLKVNKMKIDFNWALGRDAPDDDLIKHLRVHQATISELKMLKEQPMLVWDPLTERNEAAVYDFIVNTMKNMLQKFPTSIEDDNKALQKGDLSKDQRNSIVVRRGEKQLMQYIKTTCEEIAEDIRNTGLDVTKTIKERFSNPGIPAAPAKSNVVISENALLPNDTDKRIKKILSNQELI